MKSAETRKIKDALRKEYCEDYEGIWVLTHNCRMSQARSDNYLLKLDKVLLCLFKVRAIP